MSVCLQDEAASQNDVSLPVETASPDEAFSQDEAALPYEAASPYEGKWVRTNVEVCSGFRGL